MIGVNTGWNGIRERVCDQVGVITKVIKSGVRKTGF